MPVRTIAETEEDYHKALKKDMQAQDKRRFRDPDAAHPLRGLYVVYVWRKRGTMRWILAGFQRLKPTPARARRWRKKLRIGKGEVMRIVELHIAQRIGAGNPPVQRQRDRRMEREPAPLRTLKVRKVRFPKPVQYTDTIPVRAARTRMKRKVTK